MCWRRASSCDEMGAGWSCVMAATGVVVKAGPVAASVPPEWARATAAVAVARVSAAIASGIRRRVDVMSGVLSLNASRLRGRAAVLTLLVRAARESLPRPVESGSSGRPGRALSRAARRSWPSLAAADAHRLEADRVVERLEVVDQRGHDARAGHPVRVAEGDGAAVRVELLGGSMPSSSQTGSTWAANASLSSMSRCRRSSCRPARAPSGRPRSGRRP